MTLMGKGQRSNLGIYQVGGNEKVGDIYDYALLPMATLGNEFGAAHGNPNPLGCFFPCRIHMNHIHAAANRAAAGWRPS